jgi:hypothetical protein
MPEETPAAKFADRKQKIDLTPLDNGIQGAPECWVEWYVAPVLQLLPELPATQEQVHFADVHKCEGMRSATADRISQARNRNLQRDAIDLFLSTTRRIKMFCRK